MNQWKDATGQFPGKLYLMLQSANDGCFGYSSDVVSWLPNGLAFRVLDEEKFVESVAPLFFKQSKIRSFYRQLNLWGFKRLTVGSNSGAWYNRHFIRGAPNQINNMIRTKIKGKGKSTKSVSSPVPKSEPVFSNTKALSNEVASSPLEIPYDATQSAINAELYKSIISEAQLVLSIDSALSAVKQDSTYGIPSSSSAPPNDEFRHANTFAQTQPMDYHVVTPPSSLNEARRVSLDMLPTLPFERSQPNNNFRRLPRLPRSTRPRMDIQAMLATTLPISDELNKIEGNIYDSMEPLPFKDDVPFDDLVQCIDNMVHVL